MNWKMRKFYNKIAKANDEAIFKKFNGNIVTDSDIKDIEIPDGYTIIDNKIYDGPNYIGKIEVYKGNVDSIDIDGLDDILDDSEDIEDDYDEDEDDIEIESEKRGNVFINGFRSIRYGISNFFGRFGRNKKIEIDEDLIDDSDDDLDEEEVEEVEKTEKKSIGTFFRNAFYNVRNTVGAFFGHFGKRKVIEMDEDIIDEDEEVELEDFSNVQTKLSEIEKLIRKALSYESLVEDFSTYKPQIKEYQEELNYLYGEYVKTGMSEYFKIEALKDNLNKLIEELDKNVIVKEEDDEELKESKKNDKKVIPFTSGDDDDDDDYSFDDDDDLFGMDEDEDDEYSKRFDELQARVQFLIDKIWNKLEDIDNDSLWKKANDMSIAYYSKLTGLSIEKVREISSSDDFDPESLSIDEKLSDEDLIKIVEEYYRVLDAFDKELDAIHAKAEPTKAEPVKSEPTKAEPAKVEPAKSETIKSEPTKVVVDEPIIDEEDVRFVYNNLNSSELVAKIEKLKEKLVDKKFYLLALVKNGANEVEIEAVKAKINKIENKLAGYELKLAAYSEMCEKNYSAELEREHKEAIETGNKVIENDRIQREQEQVEFWTNAPEERLSQLQSYSDEDIMDLYEKADGNKIISDMINIFRSETPNDDIDLYEMTKEQLKAYALNYKGVAVPSKLNKKEMIEFIQEANEQNSIKRLSL